MIRIAFKEFKKYNIKLDIKDMYAIIQLFVHYCCSIT